MTEKELSQYKAIKNEIKDLNKRIEETKQGDVIQFGTVKGLSKYFPHTPQTFHALALIRQMQRAGKRRSLSC